MHDPQRPALVVGAAVRVVEALERLAHDMDAELERQRHLGARAPAEQVVQVEALDVFHRDEEPFALATQVVHLHDVCVAEARRQLRLVHEHVAEGRVLRQLRQDLLYDAPPRGAQLRLLTRQVNLGHPALSDEIEERVATEHAREKDVGGGRHGGQADVSFSRPTRSVKSGARRGRARGARCADGWSAARRR